MTALPPPLLSPIVRASVHLNWKLEAGNWKLETGTYQSGQSGRKGFRAEEMADNMMMNVDDEC
jgi:hypothetical protein